MFNRLPVDKEVNSLSYTRIDCRKCQHFYVTWDPNAPDGCRKFAFKTRLLPSDVVYQSSGEACKGFLPKGSVKK